MFWVLLVKMAPMPTIALSSASHALPNVLLASTIRFAQLVLLVISSRMLEHVCKFVQMDGLALKIHLVEEYALFVYLLVHHVRSVLTTAVLVFRT